MDVEHRLRTKNEDNISTHSAGDNTKQKSRHTSQIIFPARGNTVHPLEPSHNSNRKLERKAVQSSREIPNGNETAGAKASSVWKTAIDKKSGKTYYYNSVTMKSTWEKVSLLPEMFPFR